MQALPDLALQITNDGPKICVGIEKEGDNLVAMSSEGWFQACRYND